MHIIAISLPHKRLAFAILSGRCLRLPYRSGDGDGDGPSRTIDSGKAFERKDRIIAEEAV